MNHKEALEAVIAAWDAPDYGDTDTRLDNVFDAVEAARSVVGLPLVGLDWKLTSEYQNRGAGLRTGDEPELLLWHHRHGFALGRCLRFPDSEVATIAGGFHGFTFSHYAEISRPA